MSQIAEFLKSVAGLLVMAGLLVLGLVAIFVAWWIALAAIFGFALYVAVRRLLRKPGGPQRGPGGAPAVIEGEFRIERDDSPPRDRSGS